jgi:uncharacterized protein (TIGR03437 family)
MKKFTLLAFICVHSRLVALTPWFEPNQGQAHTNVQFLSRDVYLTSNKAAMTIEGEKAIVMTLVSASLVQAEGLDPQPGITSYFLGNDPTKWRSGVPHFARVRYSDVYPGIDLIYNHNSEGRLEYDFILQPGADASAIRLAYNQPVHIDSNGDLLVAGMRQKRPKVYQNGGEIACEYLVRGENQIQLALAKYGHSRPLTIDPILVYSTFLGGQGYKYGSSIAVDASGSAYITGQARAPIQPGLDPFQQPVGLNYSAYVIKLSPAGNALVYYVFIGDQFENGYSIALDPTGAAWITGETRSFNFPTKNPIQPTYGGGFNDAFVTKVSPDGRSLLFSSYLGSPSDDVGYSIAVDPSANAYVSVQTTGSLPTSTNAFQTSAASGFHPYVIKLSPAGGFIWGTYVSGSIYDGARGIAVDSSGHAFLVGFTASDDFPTTEHAFQRTRPMPGTLIGSAFVSKLDTDGSRLVYSTFLGGHSSAGADYIAIDANSNAYVGGNVSGPDFPVKNAIQTTFAGGDNDGFLAQLTPGGDGLVFSTFLGGSNAEYGCCKVAIGPDGAIYAAGRTTSPAAGTITSGQGFFAQFKPGGSLAFSSFLGGSTDDWVAGLAVDSSGAMYMTGYTWSTDFPILNAYQKTKGGAQDIFVTKVALDAPSQLQFNVAPGVLPFRFVIGAAVPPVQTISVTSGNSGQSYTAAADAAWLTLSPSSGTTPATITVSVNPVGLKAGPYTGTIRINPQTVVQVNLTVLNPPPVVTSVSPSAIPPGSDNTTITITGSGFVNGAVVQFSVGSNPLPTTFIDSGTLQALVYKGLAAAAATYTLVVVNPQSAPSQPFQVVIGTPVPVFTVASVVNAASFAGGPVAPGEIVSIFGTNLKRNVTFDGAPATSVFSSTTQVNVTVPYSASGTATVLQMGTSSVQLPVAPSAPGIFAAASAGDGIVVLYATGCGALTNDDLPRCALPISVTVNGEAAQVLYASIAPGLVQGANQINFQLPDDITSGPLTIILTAGDATSKPFNFMFP